MSHPIILVHGAYHSAKCWQKVESILESKGIDVHSIDLPGHGQSDAPLTDIYGDAKALNTLITSMDAPPVLVGHSFGGATISEAVDRPDAISHIVYVSAVLHDVGECVADTPYFGDDWPYYRCVIDNGDGTFSLDREAAADVFYHDCDPDEIENLLKTLCNQQFAVEQPFHYAPWRTNRSTYVICEGDRVLPVELQKTWAMKCNHQISIDSGHMCMISEPKRLADILANIASS